ncbi:hypothetical protein MRB53_042248 [Persea americana]|nr:hypothetical protein MRB53_042248 [Persea americana]
MNAIGTSAPLALDQDDYTTLTHSDPYDSRQTYTATKRAHEYNGSTDRDLKSQASRRPSVHSNTSHGPRKRPSRSMRPPKAETKTEEPSEDSPWIHRDKLAQIEIQEMEEAGMHVRQPNRSDSISRAATSAAGSRSVSRTGVRRAQSRDRLEDYSADGANDEAVEAYNNSYDDFERKRISVIHAAENEDEENIMHSFDPEVRTQEELAAEHYTHRQPGHAVRPSTSRIPISKTASASNSAEQDSIPRSGSGNGSNGPTSWEQLSHAQRRRTGSVGSGILLDETQDMSIARPESSNINHSSPERINTTTKATTPKSKKDKTTNAAGKNRTPSKDNAKSRPTTSHKEKPEKPEGEAPWIASMYKPDPRLPPDQQLLPTVAKRMMQEQWEREGKPGNPYDRQSRILTRQDETWRSKSPENEAFSTPAIQQPVTIFNNVEQNKENVAPAELDATQPLTSNHDRKSDSGSLRPTTSGGYRITPPPATTPPPLTNRASATSTKRESAQPQPPVRRMQDVDEKEEVRKDVAAS